MSGPTPILASHRITVPVTVDGFNHQQRYFVNAVLVGSLWKLVGTTTLGDVTWTNAIENAYDDLSGLYNDTDTAFGTAILEQYASGAYLPIATHVMAAVPAGSAAYFPAGQTTVMFRDVSFLKVKYNLMETVETPPLHVTSQPLLSGALGDFTDHMLTPTSAQHIGNCARSRAGSAITGFVSVTVTDNNRLRRDRGTV